MVARTKTIPIGPLTVNDYERLTADTDTRYELIDGVLIEMPSPTVFHQRVLAQYFAPLWQHAEQSGHGSVLFAPLDVQLSSADVV